MITTRPATITIVLDDTTGQSITAEIHDYSDFTELSNKYGFSYIYDQKSNGINACNFHMPQDCGIYYAGYDLFLFD